MSLPKPRNTAYPIVIVCVVGISGGCVLKYLGWCLLKAVARQAARLSHPPTNPHQGRLGEDQLRCASLPFPEPALSAQTLRSEWLLGLVSTKSGGAASRALVFPHPCPLGWQAAQQKAASSPLLTCLPAKPKSGGAASRALVYFLYSRAGSAAIRIGHFLFLFGLNKYYINSCQ